ncbi:hypothetical protein KHQ88_01200 [Mycoplasmatota bacterium]|nr:hypothetical protein KHQ88_01200 [Mycoplasmatota bacterium]
MQEFYYYICLGSVIFMKQSKMILSKDKLEYSFDNYSDDKQGRNNFFNDVLDIAIKNHKYNTFYRKKEYIIFARKLSKDIVKIEYGKKEKITKETITNDGFSTINDEVYPHISIYIHRKYQTIFIEDNSSKFKLKNVIHGLKDLFKSIIINSYSGIAQIEIEGQSRNTDFWKYIRNNDFIEEVEFHLLAPNFLNAGGKAKELAERIKEKYNAEKTVIKLHGEDGLIIKDDFKSYVDYTSYGAGKWKIKYRKNRLSKKTSHISSTDIVKKVALEASDSGGIDLDLLNSRMKELGDN